MHAHPFQITDARGMGCISRWGAAAIALDQLEKVSLLNRSMNQTALLEREIKKALAKFTAVFYTNHSGIGNGLEWNQRAGTLGCLRQ